MTFNILNIGFKGTVASSVADRSGYISNGDENDIFYYLGSNYGTSNWINPHTLGEITVSGPDFGSAVTMVDNSNTSTGYNNSSTRVFKAEFLNSIISPTRVDYFAHFPINNGFYNFSSIRAEVSNDDINWTEIGSSSGFAGGGSAGNTWRNIVNDLDIDFFKYLRVRLFGASGGANSAIPRIGEVKVYGDVKRIDGQEASQISLPRTLEQLADVEINNPLDGDYLYWTGGGVRHQREKLYETVRTTDNVILEDNQYLPNFYIITPTTTHTVDLPPNPSIGQFFRIRNLDNIFEVQIREPGPTIVSTIGGSGGIGLTQADCYYDGTEWSIIQY